MSGPLVTLGVPVYRGQDMLPTTLECLRTQTYSNIDVLISVDGLDQATIAACQPFLRDPRFRLHVQPSRLGWAGNTDWTMRHRRGEFFIYQQHDDQVSPTYIADLVTAASRWPQAAICYSEMVISGRHNYMVRSKPLLGNPLTRAVTHLERLDTSMFRGLIRGSALDATSGLLISEFDSFGSDHRFMTELALVGEFRFVEGPTYYKCIHGGNLQSKWFQWPEERKRAAWASLAAWMVEVIVPEGVSLEHRWNLFHTVLERFLVARGWLRWMRAPSRWFHHGNNRGGPPAPVRAVIDWLRSDGRFDQWVSAQRRSMFCEVNNNDLDGRAELLRAIIDRVHRSGKFEVSACLQSTWDTVEERTARHFDIERIYRRNTAG